MKLWQERADIPNAEGFKLIVHLADGSQIPALVFKGGDGCHKLKHANGDKIDFTQVLGWCAR